MTGSQPPPASWSDSTTFGSSPTSPDRAEWHQTLRSREQAHRLLTLIVLELNSSVDEGAESAVDACPVTGTIVHHHGRFVANVEPLARVLTHLPEELWRPTVRREVIRWSQAAKAIQGQLDSGPLRVRLTNRNHAISAATLSPSSRTHDSVVWELVADQPNLLVGLMSPGRESQWRRAIHHSVVHATAHLATLDGHPSGTPPRTMFVVAGPYAASLLLRAELLHDLCHQRRPESRRWHAWIMSNSLMLLVEATKNSPGDNTEKLVVQSLQKFTSQTNRRFDPFSIPIDIPTATRPKHAR